DLRSAPRGPSAGPLLATRDHWLRLPADTQFIYLTDEASARAGVRALAAQGAAAVKVWYIVTPDRTVEASAPAVLAAGDEARRAGLPPTLHPTGPAGGEAALRAGGRGAARARRERPRGRRRVPRSREEGRRRLLSHAHRLPRLPSPVRGGGRGPGARRGRPERLSRSRDPRPRRGYREPHRHRRDH